MFVGLVHDIGVFYLLSRAANFPELIEDRAGLHELLVQWHDSIGHALLAAMGLPEEVLVAVQEHEVERPVAVLKTLPDVLFVANKLANTQSGWRDPEYAEAVDTSALAELFDSDAIAALLAESAEEVQSLKAALTG
jgi:HD-like signal output (HDOD) protein